MMKLAQLPSLFSLVIYFFCLRVISTLPGKKKIRMMGRAVKVTPKLGLDFLPFLYEEGTKVALLNSTFFLFLSILLELKQTAFHFKGHLMHFFLSSCPKVYVLSSVHIALRWA